MSYIDILYHLEKETFILYSGCIIEKVKDGYKRGQKVYPTLEEAKKSADNGFKIIQNSIK